MEDETDTYFLKEKESENKKRERILEKTMASMINRQVPTGKRKRFHLLLGALLCWLCFMIVTPKITLSHKPHQFADMRNFLGTLDFFL